MTELWRERTNIAGYVKNSWQKKEKKNSFYAHIVLLRACVCVCETDGTAVTNDSAFIH